MFSTLRRFSKLRRHSFWRATSAHTKAIKPQETVIRSTNFDEKLQEMAKEVVKHALEHFTAENEVASFIKRKFDESTDGSWNCTVGRNFGSHVECTLYIHLTYAKIAVVLYKNARKKPIPACNGHSCIPVNQPENDHSRPPSYSAE